jgi:hypothetical protein
MVPQANIDITWQLSHVKIIFSCEFHLSPNVSIDELHNLSRNLGSRVKVLSLG